MITEVTGHQKVHNRPEIRHTVFDWRTRKNQFMNRFDFFGRLLLQFFDLFNGSGKELIFLLLKVLAAVFDFLDGMLARILNAKSAVGVELDSLADMISFGLAPAVIIFLLMENSSHIPELTIAGFKYFSLTAFILAAFSALRLLQIV